jgi:hypothetical protein
LGTIFTSAELLSHKFLKLVYHENLSTYFA